MHTQFDLEEICKVPKKEGISSNFHEFWSGEVHYKERPQKKALMFKRHNLVDPMEQRAVIFLC
jgi:hypothetical protein